MLVFEFKVDAKKQQLNAIDEAIRVTQFIRNKCIRHCLDNKEIGYKHLSALCAVLASYFEFANKLNSMARQAASERAWLSISRLYENCKKNVNGKKGYPRFQNDCRSVEYKTSGYKLSDNRKYITFTDKLNIGKLKLKGTRDLNFYQPNQIKRVRLVKRADGYYCQICIAVDRSETLEPSNSHIGLDVGLKSFYTDSNGVEIENPRFYRKSEEKLKQRQRVISRRVKGSKNRKKARAIFSKTHLRISRQRKDHAIKLARCAPHIKRCCSLRKLDD
jgi:putative transposase